MMSERLYDKSALNPKGTPEDKSRCIADVMDFFGWHLVQCSRRRGYGPNGEYCKQHAKIEERRKLILQRQRMDA